MQIGIVRLPFSGKSTLFTTLLSHKTSAADYKAKHVAERSITDVQDDRLDQLTALFRPRSQVNATVEYIKVPDLDSQNENGLSAQFFANLKIEKEISELDSDNQAMFWRKWEFDLMYKCKKGAFDNR